MKSFYPIAIVGIVVLASLFAGCASTSPSVPAPTFVPTTAVVTPTPTAVPYPDALSLDEYATFGIGTEQGKATVYRYEVRSNYNWTSPSWKSPAEQAAISQPFEIQKGYSTKMPREGTTFLFVYVRVMNTGTIALTAPSAKQFVVFFDGKTYSYSSVESPDVTIDKVTATQYDFQIGRGGTVGYIQPGESNTADGYLIYEIPAAFSPDATYLVSNLDYQTQAVWKLAGP